MEGRLFPRVTYVRIPNPGSGREKIRIALPRFHRYENTRLESGNFLSGRNSYKDGYRDRSLNGSMCGMRSVIG